MGPTLWDKGFHASTRAVLLLAVLWLHGGQSLAQSPEPEPDAQATRVDITIKARQFRPSTVSVPPGRHVVLVFHNRDAELHAFVPLMFLDYVPLQVGGNGAPQFSESGLVRVLIPSGGRTEIQFVPQARGSYQYRCDLPGHQMMGEIVVEDPTAGHGTTREPGDAAQERP